MFKFFQDYPKSILLILSLIFYIISRFVIFYKNIKYREKVIKSKQFSTEDFFKDFLRYLDKFYIKNFFFTISCVFLYFISNISWVLYLCIKGITLLNIQNKPLVPRLLVELPEPPLESDYKNINILNVLNMTLYFILFSFTIIFFKVLLNALFYDEVLKLHLYLVDRNKYPFYSKIHHMLSVITFGIERFFAKLFLFVYNVCNLQPFTDRNNPEWEWRHWNEFDPIYENKQVLKLSFFFVNLVKRHMIFLWLFKLLKIICKWLYTHMRFDHGFILYIPYLIVILIMFYDFLHTKVHYTFYAFFLLYIITIISSFKKLTQDRHDIYDTTLSRYFYDNAVNYLKRIWLFI